MKQDALQMSLLLDYYGELLSQSSVPVLTCITIRISP